MSLWSIFGTLLFIATIWVPESLKGYMLITAAILVLAGAVELGFMRIFQHLSKEKDNGR